MHNNFAFLDFSARLLEYIDRTSQPCESGHLLDGGVIASAFSDLALELFALQYERIPVYRQFCAGRDVSPATVTLWHEIPAIPTTGFKEYEISSLPVHERTTEFHSSGTTGHQPSRHFHSTESLAIYERSLRLWFESCVLSLGDICAANFVNPALSADLDLAAWRRPGQPPSPEPVQDSARKRFINLTPSPHRVPNSSLVHMFETLKRNYGTSNSLFTGELDGDGGWELNIPMTMDALEDSTRKSESVILLGTAFSYVHLTDCLIGRGKLFELPAGSEVLETGGYKGRSRSLARGELHSRISKCLGVLEPRIIREYGMSELSSQAYAFQKPLDSANAALRGRAERRSKTSGNPATDTASVHVATGIARPVVSPNNTSAAAGDSLCCNPCGVFAFPPWARVTIISPETGEEVDEGKLGLIRVFDLANVRSVMAIQTEDLGIRRGAGFELVSRTANAEPRGCSLMAVQSKVN